VRDGALLVAFSVAAILSKEIYVTTLLTFIVLYASPTGATARPRWP
jgi:hypothetical protein